TGISRILVTDPAGCVLYEAHTPVFLSVRLNTSCGLSMYLPSMGNRTLSAHYRTLAWNKATGLVPEN
ncbi:MAG: hypothetical protein MJY56_05745, partial [Bacteroidales bacterium]|nr:hypothetical protein [Bacteroidales bacterium]